ncbi:glycosyltransferase family 2 protein [Ekhidna sp. To15]|uniref:glycosyltransferase family 2 protein n=1 Tax=Ekhidna sp. To15 TaxID=3395267 RepID=UPI003F51D27B
MILTYGGREFIFEVLDYLNGLKEVMDIVVVSNGQIFRTTKDLNPNLHIINTPKNIGSAAGYSIGLDKAKEIKNKFTWLLDDDNLPEKDALYQLLKVWYDNNFCSKTHPVALQCFRTSQFAYKNLFGSQELNLLPRKNAFMCFHFKRILRIFFNRINPPLYSKQFKKKILYPSNAAFYGGLFVKTKTLFAIPPPESKYFMYIDDIEFTNNIKRMGGEIFVVTNSVINDLDYSLDLDSKRKFLYHPILDFSTNLKAFHFSKNIYYFTISRLVTNRIVYEINKVIFMAIIRTFTIIRKKKYRFRVFLAGLRSGAELFESVKPNSISELN